MDNDIPKRTRKKATTAEEPTIDEASWWNDGRLSKITGLFLLFSALVMLIAFGSHVFTAASDQSDLLNRATRTLSDNSLRVHNRMGRLGAVLSYFFIDSLFGFSAILIALLLFVVGYNLFFQQKTFGLLRWFIYSFFAINWISATFAYVNWLIYPSSAISWGGGYGRFLAGETGFFTTLLEPLGTGILLGALALGAFIWIYNYDFSKWLKAKGNQPAEEIAADEADTFRDESENIFAKDKLQEIVASTAPPFELEEEKEETDFYVKNKQVNKPVANHDLEIETNEIDEKLDEHLDLQLNDISEEVLGETKGSIGTTYDPTMSLSNFKLPKLELLDEHGSEKIKLDPEELERNKNQIVSTLNNYSIEISKIKATVGPTVTLYEIVPAAGVRISKIKNLEDDIALESCSTWGFVSLHLFRAKVLLVLRYRM
jgi:S-DNA-T family DNA segregation ATPase FtsK/SpoIIIE